MTGEGLVHPDTGINPAILFDGENIQAKTRLSSAEIVMFGINRTLIEYERDPTIDVLATLTNDVLDLTRSRDHKKGTAVDQYIEGAKIKIMSIRNLPKDEEDEF